MNPPRRRAATWADLQRRAHRSRAVRRLSNDIGRPPRHLGRWTSRAALASFRQASHSPGGLGGLPAPGGNRPTRTVVAATLRSPSYRSTAHDISLHGKCKVFVRICQATSIPTAWKVEAGGLWRRYPDGRVCRPRQMGWLLAVDHDLPNIDVELFALGNLRPAHHEPVVPVHVRHPLLLRLCNPCHHRFNGIEVLLPLLDDAARDSVMLFPMAPLTRIVDAKTAIPALGARPHLG